MGDENEDKELESEEEGSPEPETQEAPPEVPSDPNEPITVQTDDAKRETRRQRRAERQSEFKRLQEENTRYRQQLEQRQAPQYQAPPQQQRQEVHPAVARLNQIDEQTDSLHREYNAVYKAGNLTPELEAQYQRKARELQTARMATIAQASAPQINEEQLVQKAAWRQFTAENSDVFYNENQNVKAWAWAEYHRRIAEGQRDTREMVDSVLDAARTRFGLTPRKGGSNPDNATRQRLTGISARGAGAGQPSSGEIQMDGHMKKMARIAFLGKPGKDGKPMTEGQAYQHWANTVGKKLMSEKIKTR